MHVCGPRYWPQDLASAEALQALFASRTLFVQRKSRALAYKDDPSGVRSLLSRVGAADTGDLAQLCATFAAEPFVMAFAQVLCCAVLCCAVPCRAVLCCAVPCRAVPCCAVLCCAVLCCAVLCCAVLCSAVLCCAVSPCVEGCIMRMCDNYRP